MKLVLAILTVAFLSMWTAPVQAQCPCGPGCVCTGSCPGCCDTQQACWGGQPLRFRVQFRSYSMPSYGWQGLPRFYSRPQYYQTPVYYSQPWGGSYSMPFYSQPSFSGFAYGGGGYGGAMPYGGGGYSGGGGYCPT